jgi:plasmid maintenance system antidote protein VapI
MRKPIRKSESELIAELKSRADRKRGLTDMAEEFGFTIQYLSDIVNDRRPISGNLALAMGYTRIVEFERKSEAAA